STPTAPCPKNRLKKIRKLTFVEVPRVYGLGLTSRRIPVVRASLLLLSLLKLFATLPMLTVFVVLLTLARIRQHFIRFIDFLKALLRLFIIGIYIRMVFPR